MIGKSNRGLFGTASVDGLRLIRFNDEREGGFKGTSWDSLGQKLHSRRLVRGDDILMATP